jgi:alkylation response protein AidB-like acyl-CoA dehydrogenase
MRTSIAITVVKGGRMTAPVATEVHQRVSEVASRWASETSERQRRRELVRADFDALADAGFLLTGVPVEQGGMWESLETSTRPVCEILRAIAHGDSSVALVASMHPSVLAVFGWLVASELDVPYEKDWAEQGKWAFQTAKEGHFWGTITSEPGSGGDTGKTRSTARRHGDGYLMSGTKHFGSGSGITSFMITTAVPEGEDRVEHFFMDMRGVPLDGSRGVKVVAPWDGHGMIATQSHALAFTDFPVVRRALDGAGEAIRRLAGPAVLCCFTSVIVGIVEVALERARSQMAKKRGTMSAFEQVEWSNVEIEVWQAQQAYEGMLRAMADPGTRVKQTLLGKTAVAQLAESALARISKIVGGSSFSRNAPYGAWAQDVRALGFLRPPWALAYSQIFDLSLPTEQ